MLTHFNMHDMKAQPSKQIQSYFRFVTHPRYPVFKLTLAVRHIARVLIREEHLNNI